MITCPKCSAQATETMPTDACNILYECKLCRALFLPNAGDFRVFCSYGSAPRPLVQEVQTKEHSCLCCQVR